MMKDLPKNKNYSVVKGAELKFGTGLDSWVQHGTFTLKSEKMESATVISFSDESRKEKQKFFKILFFFSFVFQNNL